MSGGGDERVEADGHRLRNLIDNSSDLIGAVAGGAIGLVGGPVGSIGGAAAGVAITKTVRLVGVEVYDRLLVPRQQERVGAVLAVALADAKARAVEGGEIRDDGFFDSDEGLRADADELLEGILLQAANAYQELKLRHLGAILPSLAVRSDVSAADGHWLTRLADRLTWRQFVVLAIFAEPPEEQRIIQRDVARSEGHAAGPTGGLRQEVEELATLGLLGVVNSNGEPTTAGSTWESVSGLWGVPMARWRMTDQSCLLVDVARLNEISATERTKVLDDLLA
jgi:hypothetical protein